MTGYIIVTSTEEYAEVKGNNLYGYYTGKIHYRSGMKNSVNFPGHTDDIKSPLIKIYSSQERALNVAAKILKVCRYVKSYSIEPYSNIKRGISD